MKLYQQVDTELLEDFRRSVLENMPRKAENTVINPTPMLDLSDILLQCAHEEYGITLRKDFKVFGKFESKLPGGSVKTRPAAWIIENAITTGRLKRGGYMFEATSGNFGISLGLLSRLGIQVFTVVSRKLKEGVLKTLSDSGVHVIQLDMDICPAPGLKIDYNRATAKILADKLLSDLISKGLPQEPFQNAREEIENLLAREDIIELVKTLARIYNGFCPEQYDNYLNPDVHERITAVEIEQQLLSFGHDPSSFEVVCTFGTGGTSLGISNYFMKKYGKKVVRVIFPFEGQDVAGIRTKEKALGLQFYRPESYLGEHVADFEQAKRLLDYFVSRGISIGESSALVLYAIIQMLNFGAGRNFVAIIADGAEKYAVQRTEKHSNLNVLFEDVKENSESFSAYLWTHTLFTPSEEALKLISQSLNIPEAKLKVIRTKDVVDLLSGTNFPSSLQELLPKEGKVLLICMAGGTSLSVAKILTEMGYSASSLTGGLMAIAQKEGISPQGLVKLSSG